MDIIEVIKNCKYEKIGDVYRMFCLWHNDKGTPNLIIYPKTDSFYCFACNEFGDAEKLYCKLNNIDYETYKKTQKKDFEFKKRDIDYKNNVNIIGSKLLYEMFKKDIKGTFEKMKKFDEELNKKENVTLEEMSELLNLLKECKNENIS